MTDTQNPLQTLQNMVKNPETQPTSVPTAPTAEELAAQQEAAAIAEAELQATIKKHEEQQVAQDQEAIADLRGELPKISQASSTTEGNQVDNVNSTPKPVEEPHQVEQLQRLD
jgi:hypothetical protein